MKKTTILLLVMAMLIMILGVSGNVMAKPNKVAICHMPQMNKAYPAPPVKAKTLYIPIPALDAHLGHGDTLGPCFDPYP